MNGADLGLLWLTPFVGILLSIALLPLIAPALWHRHFGKVAAFWALAFLLPFAATAGPGLAAHALLHTLLGEYLPFIILLLALFTVAGGIAIRGNLHGAPGLNTGILGIGTLLASVMGTTGASMLLIRPLIRANDHRKHNAHIIVFFIFLVSNIGGALTPLGDPPLFLGFLQGIDFFWTVAHLFKPTLLLSVLLLAIFFVLDWYFYHYREDVRPLRADPTPDSRLAVAGALNLWLLAAIVGAVLMSGVWKPGIAFELFGTALELQNLLRDVLLVAIALLSWKCTPKDIHVENAYSWGPIVEVAKLFAAIFITIIPAIAILRAGREGALAPLVALVTAADGAPVNAMYFWLTGGLSAFLDNAPTYLVFFNLAGGDPSLLMNPLAGTLAAISAGAVFMGAITYIGNAPNFMVKAIAEERGIKMPGFFGYMAWSGAILLPLFGLIALLFFR